MSKNSEMRTPLSRVRGLGAAKEGTEHFWLQRLSAIALIPLIIWFVVSVASLAGADYAEARLFFDNPVSAILMLLLLIVGFVHLKLGIQVIVEDYIHGEALKISLLILNTLICFGLGLACIFAVLKLSFGA